MIRRIILQGLLAAAIIGGGSMLYATWASDGSTAMEESVGDGDHGRNGYLDRPARADWKKDGRNRHDDD